MMTMTQQALRFVVFSPQASEVYALGEFNNWPTVATPLARTGAGQWRLRLPAGLDPRQPAFFIWNRGASFDRFIFNANAVVD